MSQSKGRSGALQKSIFNGGQMKKSSSAQTDFDYTVSLLDKTNRQIISLLEENPMLSQTEIAEELGLSQSSIALRLDKLRKSGIMNETIGIQYKKLGLQMCRADVSCSDPDLVLNWSTKCPLLVNSSVGVGGNNVSVFIACEDFEMFQYVVDEHIRRLEGVSTVYFHPIVDWAKDYIIRIALDAPKTEVPPCQLMPYCPRCPSNPKYNGKIWNNTK